MHDERCEAHWNDGVCACSERAYNAAQPWRVPEDPPLRTRVTARLLRLVGRVV